MYCGFDSAIEVFDFARPGAGERILTSASKKTKGGQKGTPSLFLSSLSFLPSFKPSLLARPHPQQLTSQVLVWFSTGIISALAFSPHQPGLFAAGTYTRSISLYDEKSSSSNGGQKQLFNIKGIEGGGVTQVCAFFSVHLVSRLSFLTSTIQSR